MTDEEKQAIELLKIDCLVTSQQINDGELFMIGDEEKRRVSATQVLLNLIDKQQKEIERKDKVFDDCKYTIIEYVKTAKDTMQKMEAMIEIEKDVINQFDKLLKGEIE